jgi:hypothetical protein
VKSLEKLRTLEPMKVAIVHYHLQPGGVSRIIEHTISALQGSEISLAVISGQEPPSRLTVPWRVIPGLQYETVRPRISATELEQQIEEAAHDALGGPPDIYHVHNHSLGKNLALPLVLRSLAGKGRHLLLHIHDFAEDGRPANYQLMLEKMAGGDRGRLVEQLYPAGDHVHYAVLTKNSKDFIIIRHRIDFEFESVA